MTFDRPITIQRIDPDTEEWSDYISVHAWVNKARSSQHAEAGAMRTTQTLEFRMRWDPRMRPIAQDMQSFRVVYEGVCYSVEDTDDYMQRHRVFEIEGASYGS